ncbi:hypothetical protein [Pseudonocardia hydrocarbonoxydans]|uniref:hypothetical protein n=1 Tax=Pseudonocardia hydrocarbonoxydans TaxID=76726 RepID=UPI0031D04E48
MKTLSLATGLAVEVLGYLLLTQVDAATGVPLLIAGFVVLYPAVAPSMAVTTDLVVGSVPPEKAGSAGGLASTVNDLGISLGVAIIGSIGAAVYTGQVATTLPAGLPADADAAARESLDNAVAVAGQVPADLCTPLLGAARDAFSSGLNVGAATAAVIAAAGAILAATLLRHVPPTGSTAAVSPADEPVETGAVTDR